MRAEREQHERNKNIKNKQLHTCSWSGLHAMQGNIIYRRWDKTSGGSNQKHGKLPSDCVSSPIDGIKCKFKTGSAYVHGNRTQTIPQHGDNVTAM